MVRVEVKGNVIGKNTSVFANKPYILKPLHSVALINICLQPSVSVFVVWLYYCWRPWRRARQQMASLGHTTCLHKYDHVNFSSLSGFWSGQSCDSGWHRGNCSSSRRWDCLLYTRKTLSRYMYDCIRRHNNRRICLFTPLSRNICPSVVSVVPPVLASDHFST